MKTTLVGSLVTVVVSVMLMVDLPVKANDPKAGEHLMMQRMKGHEAASKAAPPPELRNVMRMLWEEHIMYTRNFIISSLAGLEDAGPISVRLLRNQDDIGNTIGAFYGENAGDTLSALLRDHILIAADIVQAAKVGDDDGMGRGQERWRMNADEIAMFLGGANPKHWPEQALRDMLYKYLDFTTAEVTSRLKKDWDADIQAYDLGHSHMMMFADALTDGILKQLPKKSRT